MARIMCVYANVTVYLRMPLRMANLAFEYLNCHINEPNVMTFGANFRIEISP